MIAEVRRSLHHAPGIARGADTPAFAGIGHKVVVPAIVTPGSGKAVGKDAAFQIFAKGLADLGLGGAMVELARRTGPRWQVHAKSRSVRLWFGRAESARGDAGCRAWTLHPLVRPRVNALALGVQWRAWGLNAYFAGA